MLSSRDRACVFINRDNRYDFVPDVLSRDEVDVWLKTSDEEAFSATHRLIRLEGLLVGGSSGSVLAGALRWLKGEGWDTVGGVEGANAVVLLPDGLVFLVQILLK